MRYMELRIELLNMVCFLKVAPRESGWLTILFKLLWMLSTYIEKFADSWAALQAQQTEDHMASIMEKGQIPFCRSGVALRLADVGLAVT
jgi:hypothetical protein